MISTWILITIIILLIIWVVFLRHGIRMERYWVNHHLKIHDETIERIRLEEKDLAEKTAKIALQHWILMNESRIRADAINRSQAVTRGKITEHLIPFFPEFGYNPKDARFLGSPVDLIVFEGMSKGTPTKIVFIEVKTGSSGLTTRERQIRDLVKEGKIEWKQINPQEK